MARYRVLEKSFIDFRLQEPGVEIDFAGKPDGNLEPLDDEARAAVEARANELTDAMVAAAKQKSIADLI